MWQPVRLLGFSNPTPTSSPPTLRPTVNGLPTQPGKKGQPAFRSDRSRVQGAPITISPEGGAAPRWSGDGRELFYITSDARVAVVTVEFGDSLVTSQPVMLAGDPLTDNPSQPEATYFDVHPDGQRLLVRPIVDGGQDLLTVLENWQALLKPRAMRSATEGAR